VSGLNNKYVSPEVRIEYFEKGRKQGAVDELEELHMAVYAKAWNKKDVLELIIKRIKELKEGV
jgi:hypothetical protein